MPFKQPYRAITTEPHWLPADRCTAGDIPRDSRRWLLDDGSLTQRLQTMGSLRVQRRYQGWQVPLPTEQALLNQAGRQLALVREVVLLLDNAAVVFARSVFPVASLSGSLTHLRKLHNTSLGTILFSHPGMRRSPFEVARLSGDNGYIPRELWQDEPAWGRRSRFEIEGKALMVSEVFLQNFTPWAGLSPVHRTQRGKVNAAIVRPKH